MWMKPQNVVRRGIEVVGTGTSGASANRGKRSVYDLSAGLFSRQGLITNYYGVIMSYMLFSTPSLRTWKIIIKRIGLPLSLAIIYHSVSYFREFHELLIDLT